MIFNYLNKVNNERKKLNDEYEKLSSLNKLRRKNTRESLKRKHDNLEERKNISDKHFKFIRDK
jgi:hypothetical protein